MNLGSLVVFLDHWISLQKAIREHGPAAKAFLRLGKQGRAPLRGLLAVPVTDQNFQLCYSSVSHPLCQEGTQRHGD